MALWIVAGLVFSKGKNRSNAVFTDAVLDAKKASRSNLLGFMLETGRLDADMWGRVLGQGTRWGKLKAKFCIATRPASGNLARSILD